MKGSIFNSCLRPLRKIALPLLFVAFVDLFVEVGIVDKACRIHLCQF